MIRAAVVASLCALAVPARAQQVDAGLMPGSSAPSGEGNATGVDIEAMKRDLLEQARREADERVQKAKDEMRNELRADLATQSANRSWEDEWQEQKKKLELIEVDGYLRVRPTLLYNMDLGVGANTNGRYLFPRTVLSPNVTDPTSAQTLSWADMRARLEPTLNISEDIRIRAQIDVFNNLILGSTPQIDPTAPLNLMSMNQLSPANAVLVRRVWGEVNTPVGLLSFGRMGDHWGMGIFHNDGNCLDCDYGDTIDRIMFTARIAGFYLMPMVDYTGKGQLLSSTGYPTTMGQPIDPTQEDDVNGPFNGPAVSLIVARRDTDKEAQRKLDNGEYVFNYGLYYSYRHQSWEQVVPLAQGAPDTAAQNVVRAGYVHEPDLWARFMNKRFKIEAEGAAILGSISDAGLAPGVAGAANGPMSILQFGGAARGEVHFLDSALKVSLEYGITSADSQTQLGSGSTYNICNPVNVTPPLILGTTSYNQRCTVNSSTNFAFNPDYRVDDILWREILGSVTDAMYVKPGVRYTVVEGFDVFLYVVYSRALFNANTPGNDPNLGVEFDPGASYTSDDGFTASLHYGGLIPLAGLNNPTGGAIYHLATPTLNPSAAHALRLSLAIKF